MNLKLNGKTALVSGSSKGIGFAIARQLAAEGAHVKVNGRTDQALATAVEQIRRTAPEAKVDGFTGDLDLARRCGGRVTADTGLRLLRIFGTHTISAPLHAFPVTDP